MNTNYEGADNNNLNSNFIETEIRIRAGAAPMLIFAVVAIFSALALFNVTVS
jgi:hypothetical protein